MDITRSTRVRIYCGRARGVCLSMTRHKSVDLVCHREFDPNLCFGSVFAFCLLHIPKLFPVDLGNVTSLVIIIIFF